MPHDAIAMILEGTLPGHPRASQSAIDRVIGMEAADGTGIDAGAPAMLVGALAWSLLRVGRFDEALHLAMRGRSVAVPRASDRASDLALSVCYSVFAETFLLNSRVSEAAAAARHAVAYAAGSEPHRFRGLSLLGAILSVNGETKAAERVVEEASQLDAGRGWREESWALLLAMYQIGFKSSDSALVQEALDSFAVVLRERDAVERAVVKTAGVVLCLLQESFHRAAAMAAVVGSGVDGRLCPPLLANQVAGFEAMTLIHLGDPGAALRILENRESPEAHTTCFELLRAGVYIQLGEPRKALEVTEACVGQTPDHCLSSLPSVFLRRAIAHELLGHRTIADADFSRATHLAAESTGIRSAVGLPLDILETLYWRLVANESDFRGELERSLPPENAYPDPQPLGFNLPEKLTDRERVLAEWIITDLSQRRIAETLLVSPNTVKTQVKSLYRKLGVTSRDEARARLGSIGFKGADSDDRR